jgi:hypothetical protein
MNGNTTDRIRGHLVGLKMPRALETLQSTLARIEQGEITALEAIEALLGEEYTTRESRRIKMALRTARLTTVKTIAGYDFSFQPSLDRNRVLALAQLSSSNAINASISWDHPAQARVISRSRSASRPCAPARASIWPRWPSWSTACVVLSVRASWETRCAT